MFSQGQLIFGILFAIVFAVIIFRSYRKDAALDKKYYKGSLWILLIFISFILGIAAIKFLLGY
ncbi:hypothetical protein N9R87_03295 [Flavobacteriaceae bacterium]|jgi:hypothetical protein|nr:hypothetical protein [Flavobacteriaceae bacterium]MDB2632113.1 hypothetical protein [Flavobacteriaceae bacterium]CAI8297185.1 MAG: Uncharacterised protein [Formosa sp. Hel3_A1_48]